jgi:hypothetical protein
MIHNQPGPDSPSSITPHTIISGDLFKSLAGPVVYGIKRGEAWVYIGMSSRGIYRLAHPQHQIVSNTLDTDDIHIWAHSTPKRARRAEAKLIKKYQPMLNRVGKKLPDPEPFLRFKEAIGRIKKPRKETFYFRSPYFMRRPKLSIDNPSKEEYQSS